MSGENGRASEFVPVASNLDRRLYGEANYSNGQLSSVFQNVHHPICCRPLTYPAIFHAGSQIPSDCICARSP